MGGSVPSETSVDHIVGERVRQRRVALDMSQSDLAKKLEPAVTFQQMQKMERGVNRIGSGRLYQLAILLKVPVGYFFEGLNRVSMEAEPDQIAANHFLGRREGQKMASAMHGMPMPLRTSVMRLIDQIGEHLKGGKLRSQ